MPKIFFQKTFYSSFDLPMKGREEIWRNNDDGNADVDKFVLKMERI